MGNKFVAVAYKLYTVDNKDRQLVEETQEGKPFTFISGMGISLESFEDEIIKLNKGDQFDFELSADKAYGDYVAERVIDLNRDIFTVDGKFDSDNIYIDAIVPLQNEDGNHFYGRVIAINDDKVKMDLNHPLAGKDLNFVGEILENRDATNEEIQSLINHLHGGCGDHCDNCKGEGGCHHEGGEHHHKDGECCGNGGCGCGGCH